MGVGKLNLRTLLPSWGAMMKATEETVERLITRLYIKVIDLIDEDLRA